MGRPLRFLLGSEPRELSSVDPTATLLDHLRQTEHRMGTKEGCAEGDCGACTVVLGRPEHGRMGYRPVCSCITFLPMVDGAQVLTIEDLREPGGALHPLQQAMVDHHGSQCGFCTPGFVMALWAFWRSGAEPTRQAVDEALAGNLCRCTGYGPILGAAQAACAPGPRQDHVTDKEEATLDRLEAWRDGSTLDLKRQDGRFIAPATVDELADVLLQHPDATILAGATDVGLWVTKLHRRLETIIWLGRIGELQGIADSGDALAIGAAVTYADAMKALVALYPGARELLCRIGGMQVRAMGTLGGNIANGSPIGDGPPFLIAAGARLVLRRGGERRTLPLEDFFIDYGRQDRRPGEFVETILLPKPGDLRLRCYKVSKRVDQDISAVCGAFALRTEGGRITTARLAFGGMAATPRRAPAAERALVGRPLEEGTVRAAMDALTADFRPISDWRASAEYRLAVARNMLLRFFLEEQGMPVRLRPAPEAAHV
jgi:xanthine dehydrogenase small subunit